MKPAARRKTELSAPDFPSASALEASPTLVLPTRSAALSVARFSSEILEGDVLEATMNPDDAFVALFQLRSHARHEILLDGRWTVTPLVPRGSLQFLDLHDHPRAHLRQPVDTLMFHLPRSVLDELAEDAGAPRIDTLAVPEPWLTADPVLEKLQHLVADGIASSDGSDHLLYEHVMLGIAAHFATRYGGLRPRAELLRGGLAPWQARRATELLADNLSKEMSLKDIAAECGLSLAYFGRAFKTSFGTSPHSWRQGLRIERAKEMLRASQASLAEIAVACGFADQSHLSRVFVQHIRMTPGAWRRLIRET